MDSCPENCYRLVLSVGVAGCHWLNQQPAVLAVIGFELLHYWPNHTQVSNNTNLVLGYKIGAKSKYFDNTVLVPGFTNFCL